MVSQKDIKKAFRIFFKKSEGIFIYKNIALHRLQHKAFHEFGGVVATAEVFILHKLDVEGNGCFHAFDNELAQSPFHGLYGFLTGLCDGNEFGD